MRFVESEVRKIVTARTVGDFAGGQVEGTAAFGFKPSGGGHFGLGGQEPAAYLVRYRGAGFLIGGLDHCEGLGWLLEVKQDVGLFSCGEGKQAVVGGLAGGPGSALEVCPCPGEAAHVDGLPSG